MLAILQLGICGNQALVEAGIAVPTVSPYDGFDEVLASIFFAADRLAKGFDWIRMIRSA